MSDTEFTVGELRRHLERLSDDTRLSFAGGMTFYRFKRCDEDEVFLEWNEPQGYRDERERKRNPHVLVTFIRTDDAADGNGMISGPIDVTIR